MSRNRQAYGAAAFCAAAFLIGCSGCQPTVAADPQQAASDARWTRRKGTEETSPFTRAQAIEALAQTEGKAMGAVFMTGLKDPDPAVRFAAAMAIGDVRYEQARNTLRELGKVAAGAERDKRVFCAIIYALHRLGDDRYTEQLGTLLFDEEKEVRANAAMVMGKMGVRGAIPPRKSAVEDRRDRSGMVKLNVLEALAKLGDERSIGMLEGFTKWYTLDFRLVAIQALGQVPSYRSRNALLPLLRDRLPRVRVAAAGALAKLGVVDRKIYRFCLRAAKGPRLVLQKAYKKDYPVTDVEIASLQELAAKSLGQMGRPGAVDVLYPLLKSRHNGVRLAAAMSILNILRGQQQQPLDG